MGYVHPPATVTCETCGTTATVESAPGVWGVPGWIDVDLNAAEDPAALTFCGWGCLVSYGLAVLHPIR